MPLVRRQRRRLFASALAALLGVILWMAWGMSLTTWVSSSPRGGGVRITRFGMGYLTVRTDDVAVGGTRGADWRRSWSVDPSGLAVALLATVVASLSCWLGFRRWVDRSRLVGRCDECGYSLVGLRSSVCPECGTSVVTAGPGRVRRPLGHRAVGPYVALAVVWALGTAFLWLGARRTTIGNLPGVEERTVRRHGVPTWLVTETIVADDGARSGTTRVQPGGLAIVTTLTLAWSSVTVWAFRRQRLRRPRLPCSACGYLPPPDHAGEEPCPVCDTSPGAG